MAKKIREKEPNNYIQNTTHKLKIRSTSYFY
jgi:hypothetical protein